MSRQRTRSRVGATVAAMITAAALIGTLGGLPPSAAADPTPAANGAPGTVDTTTAGPVTAAVSGSAPKAFKTYQLKGGYVAAGVSLRNRGSGKIKVSGIPSGAKIKGAYLFWSVLGKGEGSGFKKGKFAGKKITGTKIGSGTGPCTVSGPKGYAYRANVTKKVKRNGTFKLTGFASGTKNGADPFTTTSVPPLAEGASLVVVFEKKNYPLTKVVLSNGYAMLAGDTATTTVNFGFAATNPVGAVKTTFIGGDGQKDAEDYSTVNGVKIAAADWDGTDGPTPRYSQGNLWDTDTANLVNVVKPGNTSAKIMVSSVPPASAKADCLIWVGQAFSIGVNGKADTDGDKLLDGWEANGYDYNGDAAVDVNLPGMGANPLRKDLFVEMDYMSDALLPKVADLNRIVKVFANAPQAKNPNGSTGIRLHLDAGAARGTAYNLGGGNQVTFDSDLDPVVTEFKAVKTANFNSAARAKIFYYMIWANGYNGGTSSGNAFNIPSDSFLVTLGRWSGGGTPDERVGTFVHEFGHALGLKHGGNDDSNYKPNYLSVMNYSFQLDGVPKTNGTKYFGYSSVKLPSLNEKKLNEKKGLKSSKAKPYRTKWRCPNYSFKVGRRADRNLDWTCNGRLSRKVKVDINGDGYLSTLGTQNNWGNLVYGGGAVGGGSAAMSESTKVMKELTLEEHEEQQHR
ncbi:MAG: hypothetical protein QM650_07585 [Microlunatus sp.]